jgi:MEDS: MEthanogen/methylotroph, DcmR Sensory domain
LSSGIDQLSLRPGGHAVLFYDGDTELVDNVGQYLGQALSDGSAVIMVATPAHRSAIEGWLSARGCDVGLARDRSTFLALDAAQTLGRFLISDRPDPGGFAQVIGDLIRQAVATGRPVSVYGEMVALLWSAGHINAAIELEALWNDLGDQLAFTLFCAYPRPLVTDSGHELDLNEVRQLHSAIVGHPPTTTERREAAGPAVKATRNFGPGHGAPRAARHFVIDTLRRWGDEEFADDAAMVTTELATNAVTHARSGFTVGVSRADGMVRISVRDSGTALASDSGRPLAAVPTCGLGMVAALARRWDVEPLADGKMVWAEL